MVRRPPKFTHSRSSAASDVYKRQALKMARRFGSAHAKYDVVGFSGGFHGRTYGALSVMDKALYKDGMGPFLPHTLVLPFNDVDALEARVDENLSLIHISEPTRLLSSSYAVFCLKKKKT